MTLVNRVVYRLCFDSVDKNNLEYEGEWIDSINMILLRNHRYKSQITD